jgi:hypothetical protein
MAQGTMTITDGSGVQQTFALTLTAGGKLANVLIGDENGARALMAPAGEGAQLVSSDGTIPTYRYCSLALAMVATPTDALVIQGSATKTVRVKRIKVSGQATAQGSMPVQLIRRSTAGTVAPAVLTAIAAAKHDSTDPAATAVVSTVGTANPGVLGTSAGIVGVDRLGMSALGTGTAGGGEDVDWNFATRQDKAIVLRGVSEFLVINFNGAAIPAGGVVDFEVELEEY